MRTLIYTGILFFAAIIQSTLMVYFRPFGVIPDLLLIIVVSGSLLKGSKFGVKLGAAAGILQDILIGFFGVNTVIKFLAGFLAGNMEGKVVKKRLVVPVISIFFVTIVHEMLFLFLSEQLVFSIPLLWALRVKILPLALINALLIIAIYPCLHYLEKKMNNSYMSY